MLVIKYTQEFLDHYPKLTGSYMYGLRLQNAFSESETEISDYHYSTFIEGEEETLVVVKKWYMNDEAVAAAIAHVTKIWLDGPSPFNQPSPSLETVIADALVRMNVVLAVLDAFGFDADYNDVFINEFAELPTLVPYRSWYHPTTDAKPELDLKTSMGRAYMSYQTPRHFNGEVVPAFVFHSSLYAFYAKYGIKDNLVRMAS